MSHTIGRRAALASATMMLFAPHVARAAVRKVRLGQVSGLSSPLGACCRAFAEAAAGHPLLQPSLSIEVHHNGVLGDDKAMMRGCIDGTLDLSVVGSVIASNACPEIGLMDSPFLFKTSANARATLDGPIGQEFARLLQAKNINLVAWSENGLRHVTAKRPVRKPADLVGLKLRVPPSEVMRSSFQALGADVRTVPFPLIHEALRTGEVDAQENPIGLIEQSKLYEVQDYLCLTSHAYSCALVIASADLLEDLSADQVDALKACARKGTAASRATADADESEGANRLRAKGMQIVSDVDSDAFLAANRANLGALGAKINPAFMDRLIKAGAGV